MKDDNTAENPSLCGKKNIKISECFF